MDFSDKSTERLETFINNTTEHVLNDWYWNILAQFGNEKRDEALDQILQIVEQAKKELDQRTGKL